MARVHFSVSFERPEGASDEDCREYIELAVRSYRGGLMPSVGDVVGDPMAELDRETVVVTQMRRRRDGDQD